MTFRYLLTGLALSASSSALAAECAQSPGRVLEVCVTVADGRATYAVRRQGQPVLAPATLGLAFAGEADPRYAAMTNVVRTAADTSWEQPWGEQRTIRDHHTELALTLSGDTPLTKQVRVTFRLFDDGIGFRYAYPSIQQGQAVAITADHTQFRTLGAYQAWWYEGFGAERDEYLYTQTDARRNHGGGNAADAEGRQRPVPVLPRGGTGRLP